MPIIPLPNPAPWTTWLPSEFSDIPGAGADALWRNGLRANAGSALMDVSSVLAGEWGVDLASQAAGLLDALAEPVAQWLDEAASAAFAALGLGAAAIPVVGWIVSALSALASALIAILGGQKPAPASPIQWTAPKYQQAVDQDGVRSLLALSHETDWQAAMAAPSWYQPRPAPSPTDNTKALGGDVIPHGMGVLQPGGLADWGWYGWQPQPGFWRQGDLAQARAPSVRSVQQELWASLLGTTGIVWAVDADKLRTDWETAGSKLIVDSAHLATVFRLAGPFLDRQRGLYILADDASPEVRKAWEGRPCLVEMMGPMSTTPIPEAAGLWPGGPHPFAVKSNLAGYHDGIRRHAWLPRTASQAVVALDALAKRQQELAQTSVAAWALPSQPGAAKNWDAIHATRMDILTAPSSIEAARVRDPEFRGAVAQAQTDKPPGLLLESIPQLKPPDASKGLLGLLPDLGSGPATIGSRPGGRLFPSPP